MGIKIYVVHNHLLRGQSNADEEYIKQLCDTGKLAIQYVNVKELRKLIVQ